MWEESLRRLENAVANHEDRMEFLSELMERIITLTEILVAVLDKQHKGNAEDEL